MTVRVDKSSDLSGLDVAIRLKEHLLQRLGTRDASRWPNDLVQFVAALERSDLRNETALLVLLTEVREQCRLLLAAVAMPGEPDDAPTPFVAQAWTGVPKSKILERFKDEILDMVLRARPHRAALSSIVGRAMRVIDERYADRITLGRLAAAVGCSKRQLASIFRQELATTVHEYLTRVRLRRALELIRHGEKIEAVSLLVGYQSKKNFYHHFNAQLGVAPLSYRAALFRIEVSSRPGPPGRACPPARNVRGECDPELVS